MRKKARPFGHPCVMFVMLNVGVTTITERVPTATPGDDRGEEAKPLLLLNWLLLTLRG